MLEIKAGSSATWDMFGEISPTLAVMFFDFVCLAKRHGIKKVIITSMIREKKDDSGVHSVGRGIDVSISTMDNDFLLMAQEYINMKYQYDIARPLLKSFVIHTGSGYNSDVGRHIHLQSSS